MLVVWILFSIIFIISLLLFIVSISSLQIEVKNLIFNSENMKGSKLVDYLVYIRLKILKKITWLSIKIDKTKINKIKNSKFMDKILKMEKKMLETEDFNTIKKDLKHLKQIDVDIIKAHLYLEIGFIDAFVTSISVAAISTLLAFILYKKMNKYKLENYNYIITPNYNSESTIKIKLNCIINIKMIHIIYVIYMLKKKRSVDYDERTSNRRAYACRYE